MNLLLFTEQDRLPDGTYRIYGRRLKQLKEVIHAEPGKFCKAGLLNQQCGKAELLSINEQYADFSFLQRTLPPSPLNVTLITALQRPPTFYKILHGAITAGVKHICVIHSAKVEKSYWQSSKLADNEIANAVTLALEQCGDTIPPKIEFFKKFKPFVEDILPKLTDVSDLKIFGSPNALQKTPIGAAQKQRVFLAIGPEGGFNEFEEKLWCDSGFIPVSLGQRVLRSEYAVTALLAVLGATE